jgi:hypothetical protein
MYGMQRFFLSLYYHISCFFHSYYLHLKCKQALRAGGPIARSLFAKERKAAWVVGECVWGGGRERVKRKTKIEKQRKSAWRVVWFVLYNEKGEGRKKKRRKKKK